MKSKEDLIRKHYPFYNEDIASKDVELDGDQVKILMDEYAKQEAIEFGEWIKQNAYHAKGDWYLTAAMSGDIYEIDELYNLYLESKKQKV